MTPIEISVHPDGTLAAIHNDALADLCDEGKAEVKRASHVEPIDGGDFINWVADLSPMGGPKLQPRRLRSEALADEVAWLKQHGF
jgi:hypothetical protein